MHRLLPGGPAQHGRRRLDERVIRRQRGSRRAPADLFETDPNAGPCRGEDMILQRLGGQVGVLPGARRMVILARASSGMTVLEPAPV